MGEIQTPMDIAAVEFIDPREPVSVSLLVLFVLIALTSVYVAVLDRNFH